MTCNAHVYWWDGEYEGDCELPTGHDGPHWDGVTHYTGEGTAAEPADAPDQPKQRPVF